MDSVLDRQVMMTAAEAQKVYAACHIVRQELGRTFMSENAYQEARRRAEDCIRHAQHTREAIASLADILGGDDDQEHLGTTGD